MPDCYFRFSHLGFWSGDFFLTASFPDRCLLQLKLLEKAVINQVARHDSRHRGRKKAGMQRMHTILKLAQLRWTDYVIGILDERLPKKFSMDNHRMESALKVARRNVTKTLSKPL